MPEAEEVESSESVSVSRPRLTVVATPIGNLGDLSARAIETLTNADAIACEDTRHTRRLLSAHSIAGKRLLAVHEHNEIDAAQGIVALIERGQHVALVSDAGTPGVSDPGSLVVRAAIDAGLTVEAVPGASAFLLALVVSGLPTDRFCFDGFLPRSGANRRKALAEVASSTRTTVLYEAPNRVDATLRDLAEVCGASRQCSISRELTKRFETTWRGTLGDAIESSSAKTESSTTTTSSTIEEVARRGEYVLVIAPAPPPVAVVPDVSEIRRMVDEHRANGTSTKDAVDLVAQTTGTSKKVVYEIAVAKQ